MPILVATDREVVVIDVERDARAPAHGIGDRPTCLAADALFTDGRGVALTGTACSGAMMAARSWRSGRPGGPADHGHRCEPRRAGRRVGRHRAERSVALGETPGTHVAADQPIGDACPRRRNGRFRRDRTLITFAGSRVTRSNRNDSGSRSRQARSCRRSMAAAPGATASLVGRGTLTSSPFTATLPIRYVSPLAMDISKATTAARRGARPAPVSRSATCAAWRSIRSSRTSSWSQRRPDHTPRTWLAARMADCIDVSRRDRWERVRDGWPEPASTIAPLLCAGETSGELWAADERGLHRSDDSGTRWRRTMGYATSPQHLRGLAVVR